MNVLEVDFEKNSRTFPAYTISGRRRMYRDSGSLRLRKSMTFKVIAGIATPDSGKICLGKRELFHRGHKK